MVLLFKDGSGTFEQGLDLVRRREFDRAVTKFLDAAAKYRKEGSIPLHNLSMAYTQLLSLGVRLGHPEAYRATADLLRSTLGDREIHLGARSISASELANQMELTSRDLTLMIEVQRGSTNPELLSQNLQSLANSYRAMGNQVLYLPELFQQQAISTEPRVAVLMAYSFETLGNALESRDPLAAAENFQTAQQYWIQAGDEARSQAAATRVGHLSFQARCWFCGREGTGHGVQFVSLPISENVAGLKETVTSSPLPSIDATGRTIYACKGCFSAAQGLADRVALQRVSEAEARLNARIQALEHRIQGIPRIQ